MTYEALNIITTEGQFAVERRRLQTMTIVFNETAQRYVVKNDSDGRTYAAGFSSIDEAVKACKVEDERRYKVW